MPTGQISPSAATAPVFGPLRVNAADFGVSPSNPDNGPALQAAYNHAASLLASYPNYYTGPAIPAACVFVPAASAPYVFKTPVYLWYSHIGLEGEGSATWFTTPNQSGITILYPGLLPGNMGTVADATYRPDCYGKLDSTLAPATGHMWGFRTHGSAYLTSQFSPLSHGPLVQSIPGQVMGGWGNVAAFTIDFCVEGFASGQVPSGASICGIGRGDPYGNGPGVWSVRTTGVNTFAASIGVSPSALSRSKAYYTGTFTTGSATGPQRISFQFDSVTGTWAAFADTGTGPTQLTVAGTPPPAGSRINENVWMPFAVNSDEGLYTSNGDFALYALNVSTGLRYASKSAGQPKAAHPQFAMVAGNLRLLMPGDPQAGTFDVHIPGFAALTGLSATITPSALQSALQGIGYNVTVSDGTDGPFGAHWGVRHFQLAPVGGFTGPTPAPGWCDGSNLSGFAYKDIYLFAPPAVYAGFFVADAYSVAFLPFGEDPAGTPRQIAVQGGATAGGAYGTPTASALLRIGNEDPQVPQFQVVRDISFANNSNVAYGQPVAVASVLNTVFERCSFAGGAVGVGSLTIGATYTLRFDSCSVAGTYASIYLYATDAIFDRMQFGSAFRFGCLTQCSVVVSDYAFFGDTNWGMYAQIAHLQGGYGGQWVWRDTVIDAENTFWAPYAEALFFVEAPQTGGLLTIEQCYTGQVGTVPAVKLTTVGGPPSYPVSTVRIHGMASGSTNACVVGTNGPGWQGRVTGTVMPGVTPVASDYSAGAPGIVFEGTEYRTFPRTGLLPYVRGSIEGVALSPADGAYTRYAVAAPGTWGTPTPPILKGLDPVSSDPATVMAGYAIGHTCISATLNGTASTSGFLVADYAGFEMMRHVLGVQALTAPASWQFGLLLTTPTGVNAAAWCQEITDANYARVAVANNATNFPASASGSKAMAGTVTWPALATAQAISGVAAFRSDDTAHPRLVLNFATPVALAAGTVPTLASLAWAHVPLKGDYRGCMTDWLWGKLMDLVWGGASFAMPSGLYEGLSTAEGTRASTSLAEPAGNNYARAPIGLGTGSWQIGGGASGFGGNDPWAPGGEARNAAAIAFNTPSGPAWGTLVARGTFDAATAGNLLWTAPLVASLPTSTATRPTFPAGSLVDAVC